MVATRHYLYLTPGGTICLAHRWTGMLSPYPFPVQMLDENKQPLAQPYPDPPGFQHGHFQFADGRKADAGLWPLDLSFPQEPFMRIEVSAEQFAPFVLSAENIFCHWYNQRTRRVELRPGHHYVPCADPSLHARALGITTCWHGEVRYADLERAAIVWGGKPLYWIKWHSEKRPEDFPDVLQAGLLHPIRYKPKPDYVDFSR